MTLAGWVYLSLIGIFYFAIFKLVERQRQEREADRQEAEAKSRDDAKRQRDEQKRQHDEAVKRRNDEVKRRNDEERAKLFNVVEQATAIVERNKDVIEKFLSIAESKVSIIDEYGDENWDALPGEIKTCLKKIANRERLRLDWKPFDPEIALKLRHPIDTNDQPPGPIPDAVSALISLGYTAPGHGRHRGGGARIWRGRSRGAAHPARS